MEVEYCVRTEEINREKVQERIRISSTMDGNVCVPGEQEKVVKLQFSPCYRVPVRVWLATLGCRGSIEKGTDGHCKYIGTIGHIGFHVAHDVVRK